MPVHLADTVKLALYGVTALVMYQFVMPVVHATPDVDQRGLHLCISIEKACPSIYWQYFIKCSTTSEYSNATSSCPSMQVLCIDFQIR